MYIVHTYILFSRLATQRAFRITCILRTGNKGSVLTIQSGKKGSILTMQSGNRGNILTLEVREKCKYFNNTIRKK